MSEGYERVMEMVASDPDRKIWDLPVLAEAERQKLLVEWNDTGAQYSQAITVQDLFDEQVKKTPDAIAVVYGEQHISYDQLDDLASRLASHLRDMGIGPDKVAGLCVDRSLEMIVGVLGILKAGGACLPLEAAYPEERLRFMIDHSRATVVVTRRHLLERLPGLDAKVFCLDSDWRQIATRNSGPPACDASADNLAYVIYTSGSTGTPKGVTLPHRALSNLIEWHRSTLAQAARTLQFASLSFDASFHEIFATFASGGTLFVVPEELRVDTPGLADYLQENLLEKLILPVVVLQQLAEEYCSRQRQSYTFKEIITTGEQLQVTRTITRFLSSLQGCSLHNHYGPSESHVVTAFIFKGAPDAWPAYPPIGKPISNNQIYLLDHRLNLVPLGSIGEIYIGGVNLARGYLNGPGMTAERFVPNPFDDRPGQRLYKTGDLAHYLEDGNIEFLGRVDSQVKIRGFRVELGEIEAVLGHHPAVQETIVVTREDAPGERRLVAYIVPDRQTRLTAGEVRSYLKERLPDYMVPSAVVIMDNLPLTPNGKIDRAALTATYQPVVEVEELVLPRTPAEELVAAVWGSLLGIEKIGIDTDFFHLGGHSLLASRIIIKVREIFRVDIPLRTMFELPTVNGQVKVLSKIWGGREIVEEIAWTHMQVGQLSDSDVRELLERYETCAE